MSNTLIKIIDNSLLPAILLIFGKFFGVFITASIFQLNVTFLTNSDFLFTLTPIVDSGDLATVSTYSDIFMFALIAIGFIIIVINSIYFHESHIKVSTIAKLADKNLLNLVRGSYEIYHSGITWFIFIWLAVVIIVINTIFNQTQYWVLIISGCFSLGLSVILFRDLIQEFELAKDKYFKNE